MTANCETLGKCPALLTLNCGSDSVNIIVFLVEILNILS